MSFAMNSGEIIAATDAMNGITPERIMHLILFTGSLTIIFWSGLVFIGVFRKLNQHRVTLDEALSEIVMAIVVLIMALAYTIYT